MENLTKSPTQILQSPPKYTLDNVVARRMIFYDTVPRATDIQYGLIQFRDFWLKMRTTQYMVGKKEWNTLIVIFVNDFILALWCRRPIKPTIQINEFQPKSKFYEYIHTHTHTFDALSLGENCNSIIRILVGLASQYGVCGRKGAFFSVKE